jgi:translation elongation factor EF-1beta
MGSIQRLIEEMADTEVVFLLVSPEEPRTVDAFLRRYSYTDLPVYLEIQEMPSAFGLEALPTTYVVDKEGNIALNHRGALEWDDPAVVEFLRALLLD